ncbi:hypothetical protein RD792_016216 [Penstemon davidsonii]|uniref:Arylformamidase n=1 Tax=Penstemon davidsonii TaxID=160366 RepID=A0ABR0CJN0_9LAMI|nr:hypothetical protein RD792_016216 [Penstemon davidsonii]
MTPFQYFLLTCAAAHAVLSSLTLANSDAAYPPPYGLEESSFTTTASAAVADDLVPIRREVYGGGRIIDISHRLHSEMPSWESSDGLGQFLWLPASMKNGSLANNSEMKFSVHTGTHVDAPGHMVSRYFDTGFDVDTLDLEVLNGPALLVDVPRDTNITAEVMRSLNIPKGVRRVLFRTLNTDRRLMYKKEFDSSYVGFMKDGAQWLVDNTDIKLVGIDYLSVAAFVHLVPSHLVFFEGREIILVEGLKLDNVEYLNDLIVWCRTQSHTLHLSQLLYITMTKLQTFLLTCAAAMAVLSSLALANSITAYPPPYGLNSYTTTPPAADNLVPARREVYGGGRIIDISHRYHSEMPSWGTSDGIGQFLWLPNSMKNGSRANNSEMKLPTHTGTHVDAPGHVFDHYFDAGFDVDTLDLDVLNGLYGVLNH